jgi:hypothetical protein
MLICHFWDRFLDEKSSDNRSSICKDCEHETEREPYGTCCESHFQDMMITNTFTQLTILLEQVNVFRLNGVEIPLELLKKMFNITHLANVRCRYDNCSKGKIGEQIQP